MHDLRCCGRFKRIHGVHLECAAVVAAHKEAESAADRRLKEALESFKAVVVANGLCQIDSRVNCLRFQVVGVNLCSPITVVMAAVEGESVEV